MTILQLSFFSLDSWFLNLGSFFYFPFASKRPICFLIFEEVGLVKG